MATPSRRVFQREIPFSFQQGSGFTIVSSTNDSVRIEEMSIESVGTGTEGGKGIRSKVEPVPTTRGSGRIPWESRKICTQKRAQKLFQYVSALPLGLLRLSSSMSFHNVHNGGNANK